MKPIKSNLHKIHEPTCVTHASLVTNSTPSQARSRFMVTMIWITTMSTFFTTSKPMPSWTTTWRSLKWWLLCFKVKKKSNTHHIVFCFSRTEFSNFHWFKHCTCQPDIYLWATGGIFIRQYGRLLADSYQLFILLNTYTAKGKRSFCLEKLLFALTFKLECLPF